MTNFGTPPDVSPESFNKNQNKELAKNQNNENNQKSENKIPTAYSNPPNQNQNQNLNNSEDDFSFNFDWKSKIEHVLKAMIPDSPIDL